MSGTNFVHIAFIHFILYLTICNFMLFCLTVSHNSELTGHNNYLYYCNVCKRIVSDTLLNFTGLDLTIRIFFLLIKYFANFYTLTPSMHN